MLKLTIIFLIKKNINNRSFNNVYSLLVYRILCPLKSFCLREATWPYSLIINSILFVDKYIYRD